MKVLWFTSTPSLYKKSKSLYNGCGWIESLELVINNTKDIELAISFFHSDECFKSKQGETTYYPISIYNGIIKKLAHSFFYESYDKIEVAYFMKVISDFKPDVIHIFGSEKSFGLISTCTNIPVVIHLQGILNTVYNAYFAPGSNKYDIVKRGLLRPFKLIHTLSVLSFFTHNTKRESIILENCKYFIGRTSWDREIVSLYSPNSTYFYCSEALRDIFYIAEPWIIKKRSKTILISTISKTTYKGFDLILKTAKLLTELTKLNFEWLIFGVDEFSEWEEKLGIKVKSVNVILGGITDSNTLAENIQEADIFVHPSYIDNSPNSICEAQILGIPVISTNVGGIGSLIEDNKTGYLIPANDPFCLAAKIIELKNNMNSAAEIGVSARKAALLRHDKETIKNDLITIYNKLYKCKD